MAKKTTTPKTDTTPSTPFARKAKRKPRDPSLPKKEKGPWNERQLKRMQKVTKRAAHIAKIVSKAENGNMNDLFKQILIDLTAVSTWLESDPAATAFKPLLRGKVKIDSVIVVKSDETTRSAPVFTRKDPKTGEPYLSADLFINAVVVGDDRTAWFVTCTDGQSRLINKKFVEIAS